MSNKIVVGMKVRAAKANYHNAAFGAVGTVLGVYGGLRGDDACVLITCRWPEGDITVSEQFIELQHLKPAKQANKKGNK